MDINDVLYKPNIPMPEREVEVSPSAEPESLTPEQTEEIAARIGVQPEDIPSEPFDLMRLVFANYQERGLELRRRAEFLLEKAIDNLDGYIGAAPPIIHQYVTLLFGRPLEDLEPSDEALTLTDCEKRCLFRIAGYFNPVKEDLELMDAVSDYDSKKVRDHIVKKINTKAFMDVINRMWIILVVVLKMSYVIAIHYTVGYVCAWFKGKIKIGIRRPRFRVVVGDKVAAILKSVENKLLGVVGYRCNAKEDPVPPCSQVPWEKISFNRINCCTKLPLFFVKGKNGEVRMEFSRCFQKFIRAELDPNNSGDRVVCSSGNCADDTLEASAEEIESAKIIVNYLLENGTRYDVMERDNIPQLSRAIAHADTAVEMSKQVESSISTAKTYQYTGNRGSTWDCFGYTPIDDPITATFNSSRGTIRVEDMPLVERGMGIGSMDFLQYLNLLDTAVASGLKVADKITTGTAGLTKWASSKELCCWIYLFVVISSMWWNLKKHGTLCPDKDKSEDLREKMRIASTLRAGAGLSTFVALLRVLKQVVDMFRMRMKRRAFLAGIALPLHDMWEQIKLVIANGLAQMLDVLFGPLDLVLSGLRGLPELRMMIDNDCFGVGKFLDFLSCLLGDLKASLVNWVMQFIDVNLNDFVLINDIYISRHRLAFLDALSRLLGNMIKLILGLRDCYDPSTLTDEIVQKQIDDQYNELKQLAEIFRTKEDQEYLELIATTPVMEGTTIVGSAEEIAGIDGMSGSISSGFADSSNFFATVVDPFMREATAYKPAMPPLTAFTDQEGNLVSLSKFIDIMTEKSGVGISEMKESMRSVYDIIIQALEREN